LHTGDFDGGEEEDEGRMVARSEYQGFEHLLTGLPQMVAPLAEASAPHEADIPTATAVLHRIQYAAFFHPRTLQCSETSLHSPAFMRLVGMKQIVESVPGVFIHDVPSVCFAWASIVNA
jgi:hypothetical protein